MRNPLHAYVSPAHHSGADGFRRPWVSNDVILYSCLIVAVIFHEVSHGLVALAFGDDTAKRAGRITLNPVSHIDPLGSIVLPLIGVITGAPVIGWAKPVPVNPARLRSPRRHMLYVGLAGPATNFGLMAVAAVVARSVLTGGSGELVFRYAFLFAAVNLWLGVFNLLPIPPLDGSSLIERVLPDRALPGWYKFRPYGMLVLFLVVFTFDIFGKLLAGPTRVLDRFVLGS